jgi:hypothetical protein
MQWESYYYEKLGEMMRQRGKQIAPREYIDELGCKLYTKISEVIQAELERITEKECITYIRNLVINRTFEGYRTEIRTSHGQLREELAVNIVPAPDEWDRRYNVDFFIDINGKLIGLQIKPISYKQTPEIHRWQQWLEKSHQKFRREKGGKVFVVFSVKEGGKKVIFNRGVVDEIAEEIKRLRQQTRSR